MGQSFIERIRETHRDPRNVAMHAAGWILAVGAVRRLVHGEIGGAVARGALAVALMGAGHLVEGNEPFGVLRERMRARGVEEV